MCHPCGPVEGCKDCGSVEKGVGCICPDPLEYIATYRTQKKASMEESKTPDDSKQTANSGRLVQSIHVEVGTGGQCSM